MCIRDRGGTTLTPTYTPAAGDAGNIVTLTLHSLGNSNCAEATATKSLSVFAIPTAAAGAAANTCVTTAYTVSGASVSNNSGINWTHNGLGVLTNITTITPTYTPVAGDAGNTVILTLHSLGNSNCAEVTATKNLSVLAIPTAVAGAAANTCVTTAYTVSGASVSNNSGINWTHNGLGVLTNITTITPTYTPVAGDAGNTVILTLHSLGNSNCAEVTATKNLSVLAIPTAVAGAAVNTCVTTVYTVSGASVSNNSGINWTHNGLGVLTNITTITPTYTPVA